MNFKISKNKLNEALQLVSKASANVSPIPTLSGIKIDVSDNDITLIASDGDISIKKTLNNENYEDLKLSVIQKGSIVIDTRYLLEVVRKIDASTINFEIVDGSIIKIKGNQAEYNINGMRSSDYPLIDFNKLEKHFVLNSNEILKIINQTLYATSDKEYRPILTGVNFNLKNGVLNCVATDSYRLSRKKININSDLSFNITIPSKSLNELSKAIESSSDIDIYISDNKIQFYIDNAIIQSRLIDGIYPETDRLIPDKFTNVVKFNTKNLQNSIDRAIFIKNEGVSIVKLTINEKEATILTKSQEVGSLEEKLDYISYDGEEFNISFSGNYLLDALKSINSENIKISFSGSMKPFILEDEKDESTLQLILPVRTYN